MTEIFAYFTVKYWHGTLIIICNYVKLLVNNCNSSSNLHTVNTKELITFAVLRLRKGHYLLSSQKTSNDFYPETHEDSIHTLTPRNKAFFTSLKTLTLLNYVNLIPPTCVYLKPPPLIQFRPPRFVRCIAKYTLHKLTAFPLWN
jgi:hypothetical protein